jgi:tRNA pseudouridine13 synthase
MKVKSLPADFIVEELTDVLPGESGEFAMYKLDKENWTTPDALAIIRRRWQIAPQRLAYGGLKDRHAITTQYLSILRGPMRNLNHERLTLTYLGRVKEPYSSQSIRANRFQITLRGVQNRAAMEAAAMSLLQCGVPNYFDDQRFGSVNRDGRFIALEMVKGNFEAALKLAIAEPGEHDRSAEKKQKAMLRQHWGDWRACREKLPRSGTRSIVEYLVHHPSDYRGAVARLPHEIASLYLSAYQSHVWNRMLSEHLKSDAGIGLSLKLGVHSAPVEPWDDFEVPLPSARWKPAPEDPWRAICESLLQADGITLEAMKIPGLEKPYFSKGMRAAKLKPERFRLQFEVDSAKLDFELPRGSYATMIVKRLTASAA